MPAYPQRKLWSERTCKYMWPLRRKRSLGMNARQANVQHAHGWGTDSRAVRNRSGERMRGWRKCLNGCSQTETWLTKILNGCSRTDTRVTSKFLNGFRSKGWTAGRQCDVPSIFGANSQRERLGAYSMHNFAITEVIRMLVSENDEWK